MTLIVGRIVNEKIYIESDTKITDDSSAKDNPLLGSLKIIIFHPFISLTFAGKLYFAERAVKEILSHNKLRIKDILDILLTFNNESIKTSGGNPDLETDFVLAVIENKKPRLFKIVGGELEADIESFWLGDKRAFNIYQRHFHKLKEENNELERCMHNAFESVIEDDSINTVGNFQISMHVDDNIAPNEKVFLYSLKTEISIVEPQSIHCKEANKYYPVPLGTTGGGAYGISYLVSVSPNLHGVALHFLYGNFGVLFCPQLNFEGIIIKNVNGKEFASELKKRYNLPLRGFIKLDETKIQYIDTRDEINNN